MKNEQMNLEMLYTEIAAASSVDFSDKIHEWIKASANTYGLSNYFICIKGRNRIWN